MDEVEVDKEPTDLTLVVLQPGPIDRDLEGTSLLLQPTRGEL